MMVVAAAGAEPGVPDFTSRPLVARKFDGLVQLAAANVPVHVVAQVPTLIDPTVPPDAAAVPAGSQALMSSTAFWPATGSRVRPNATRYVIWLFQASTASPAFRPRATHGTTPLAWLFVQSPLVRPPSLPAPDAVMAIDPSAGQGRRLLTMTKFTSAASMLFNFCCVAAWRELDSMTALVGSRANMSNPITSSTTASSAMVKPRARAAGSLKDRAERGAAAGVEQDEVARIAR